MDNNMLIGTLAVDGYFVAFGQCRGNAPCQWYSTDPIARVPIALYSVGRLFSNKYLFFVLTALFITFARHLSLLCFYCMGN